MMPIFKAECLGGAGAWARSLEARCSYFNCAALHSKETLRAFPGLRISLLDYSFKSIVSTNAMISTHGQPWERSRGLVKSARICYLKGRVIPFFC
ncbi:hypothetical protein VTI28DRAFT_4418 [Corynascus sepedonium]